jgi:extracellular factor (EF) 3-hydroxypalmitic acid methyl ester biosynthesis protein
MSRTQGIEHSEIDDLMIMQTALGLLNELNEEDVDWIFRTGFERQVIANTVIVREGEPLAYLYIVLEGLFGVRVASVPDAEIGRLGPGEIIGEISFLENMLPTATVIAIESSLLLEIPSALLAERLKAIPSFGAQFYRALAILNSRRVRERVSSLTTSFLAKLDATSLSGETSKTFFSAVERFKSLLIQADGEALKNGGQVPEATALTAERAFLDFCRVIHDTIGGSSAVSSSVKTELGARLQREMLPFILLTQTTERFYSKPRGYAGDFQTIEMIYRNRPAGTKRIGPLLDRCFLSSAIATAIRNRRVLLAKEIMETVQANNGAAHVTCLACGPAHEVFDVFQQLDDSRRLQASLIDIDLQALAYVAERRDNAGLQNRINLINANLVYLALGRQKLELRDQDLIYSLGLIDYFNDKFVIKLLNWIHGRLRPGGTVILSNFHPNNYCKEVMDYVLEWRLLHRSEEEMHRLFTASFFGRPCSRIQFESEGISFLADCIKE